VPRESAGNAKITLSDSFSIGVQTSEPPPIRAHWPALAKDTGKRLDRIDSPIQTVLLYNKIDGNECAWPGQRQRHYHHLHHRHRRAIKLSRVRLSWGEKSVYHIGDTMKSNSDEILTKIFLKTAKNKVYLTV